MHEPYDEGMENALILRRFFRNLSPIQRQKIDCTPCIDVVMGDVPIALSAVRAFGVYSTFLRADRRPWSPGQLIDAINHALDTPGPVTPQAKHDLWAQISLFVCSAVGPHDPENIMVFGPPSVAVPEELLSGFYVLSPEHRAYNEAMSQPDYETRVQAWNQRRQAVLLRSRMEREAREAEEARRQEEDISGFQIAGRITTCHTCKKGAASFACPKCETFICGACKASLPPGERH